MRAGVEDAGAAGGRPADSKVRPGGAGPGVPSEVRQEDFDGDGAREVRRRRTFDAGDRAAAGQLPGAAARVQSQIEAAGHGARAVRDSTEGLGRGAVRCRRAALRVLALRARVHRAG